MAFDYKKEYKEFYLPPRTPGIVEIPAMNFIAVRGQGDPNEPDGPYQDALRTLYAVAYTLKMSSRGGRAIPGYFPYVVPPLEGLWRQAGGGAIDYARKADFQWTAMIRLPDFVTEEDFAWALREAREKKGLDLSPAVFLPYREGLCVQCMHLGPYDSEPATIAVMDAFALDQGYVTDLAGERLHHEIYLSDPRRTAPEKLRTVVRHPIRPR